MINSKKGFNFYMTLLLLKQGYEWSCTIDQPSLRHDLKRDFNLYHNHAKRLVDTMEKELSKEDQNVIELYWENSEYISKLTEKIIKSSLEDRNKILEAICMYVDGNFKFEEV